MAIDEISQTLSTGRVQPADTLLKNGQNESGQVQIESDISDQQELDSVVSNNVPDDTPRSFKLQPAEDPRGGSLNAVV